MLSCERLSVLTSAAKLILLVGPLFLATVVSASPYSDGNAAYKARDYQAAATDFEKAIAASTGAEKAKAYYKLGLTYRKESRDSDALSAFQRAQSIDPTLSFASSPDKFQQMETSVEAASSKPAAGSSPSSSSLSVDPVGQTLTSSDVYVDKALQPYINSTTLEQVAQDDDHTPTKIAVLDRLPSNGASLAGYTKKLHDYLDLGRDPLIVVGIRGSRVAVEISADTLTSNEEHQLSQKYIAQIGSGNVTAGISALISATASEIDTKERRMPDIILTAVLVAIVIAAILIFAASRRKKAEMQTLRIPLESLRNNVLENIQYIDNYADVLPKNNADTDQVRAYRQAAEAKFEQASKIIVNASDTSELYRAQSVLDKANADLAKAREFLDRATGGTSKIPGDEAIRPIDIPKSTAEAQHVPHEQRGVSFFSSQPAPISSLVPVTLNIDGQTRTVMATPAEAEQIRMGQIPPVRAFSSNGQMVPWYNYQNYDPYRDYYQYQNQGWGGFGSGAVAGFIGAELLDSLFRPNYNAGWYSPYGYSPGFGSFGGWSDFGYGGYDQGFLAGEQRADNYAFQDQFNQAPLGNFGSGYDQSDYGNTGGSSYQGGGDLS
jgi:tetratricopeptide (TPR) repeat protein